MSRQIRMALIAVLIVPLLLLTTATQASEAPTTEEPQKRANILLVVADDLGWTDLGAYGSEIKTPNLDQLAKRGVQFTSFYASVSCSPTRAMLMTGTDNHVAGLGTMSELLTESHAGKPGYEGFLNQRVITLAEVLRHHGYHTYMAGKWHLGHQAGQFPFDRGFDTAFSMLFGGASYWRDRFGLLAGQEEFAEYTLNGKRLETLPEDFYATRNYTDFLIEAIRKNRGDGKPFLAYLAFTAPHDPMHVPEPWLSMYQDDYNTGYDQLKEARAKSAQRLGVIPSARVPAAPEKMTKWEALSPEEKALSAKGMEVYAGMVTNMDYHFGRVMNFLSDIDELENTIVVFLSDNGSNPWFSEDYPGNRGSEWLAQFDNSVGNIGHPGSNYAYGIGWAHAGSGPLDLFKMTVGEGGIRVPLIMAGPGINGGRRSNALSYVWDIMPTLLSYANAPHLNEFRGHAVEPMKGRSMRQLLAGDTAALYAPEDPIAGEMGGGKWIRRGDFKAVSIAPPYGDGEWQLYNIAKDPGETRDLSSARREVMQELIEQWKAYAQEVGVVP